MIVLLTDFGASHYVGIMKGVIAGIVGNHPVTDLTHDVTPYNIREGAWILYASYRYFPCRTIFCAVVDPEVGGDRQALIIAGRHYYFVGPDNGILLPAAEHDGIISSWALPRTTQDSYTFEGRDVFAPAAAHLAADLAPETMAQESRPRTGLRFYAEGREGEIVYFDRFGNIITTLAPVSGAQGYRMSCCGRTIELPYYASYCRGRPGDLMVTTGSTGTLEVAVPQGSAVLALGNALSLSEGARITLEPV